MAVELPVWLQQLRRTEVVERVREDSRSAAHPETFLGLRRDAAWQVVGGGQADFDQPWGDLTPGDRVLLYAYFLQKGHLEELTAAFQMMFGQPSFEQKPIVVDLGCGPFTGGLALSGALGGGVSFDYIGIDRSEAMHRLGEHLASKAEAFNDASSVSRLWSAGLECVPWCESPGWRPVVVILSYLLASPTFDVREGVGVLNGLLTRIGRGPVTVLYTNSVREEPNQDFPVLRDALEGVHFTLEVDDRGTVEVDRWDGVRERELRYALFHRHMQQRLTLGGE